MALYSKKAGKSHIDSHDKIFEDSEDDTAMFVKRYGFKNNKRSSGSRHFQSRADSSASKPFEAHKKSDYDTVKKGVTEQKGKCFNYGSTENFARECKSKKTDSAEDYEVKYKKFMA